MPKSKRVFTKNKSSKKSIINRKQYKNWIQLVSQKYSNYKNLKNVYKKQIKEKNQFQKYDQLFGDKLQDLMTFVGNSISDQKLHEFFPDLDDYQYIHGKLSIRNIKNNEHPIILFKACRDGSGHFNTKMPNEPNFDPYDEYQIEGTHQFCQTFALMKLIGHLPQKMYHTSSQFEKFYFYSEYALEFIKKMILTGKKKKIEIINDDDKNFDYQELLNSVTYFLKYPAITINIIEHLEL